MALEDLTGNKYISDLVATNPVGSTDSVSDLDGHDRGIKNVLQKSFPNVNGACTPTPAEFNVLSSVTAGTAAASKAVVLDANKDVSQINVLGIVQLDLNGTTVTSSAAELNYNDITALGTVDASKTVTADANKDISGARNLTITGNLTVDTNTLYVDSTNNRVGVLTNSPVNDLDVLKTSNGVSSVMRVASTSSTGANNATCIINSGGSGNATLRFDYESATDRASIKTKASINDLVFSTNGSERFTIASDGGMYSENATGGSQGVDTINASGIYDDGVAVLTAVTEANITWASAAGLNSNHISASCSSLSVTSAGWTDFDDGSDAVYLIYVPANASTLNYACRGTDAGGSVGQVRIIHSAHNGTAATIDGTNVTSSTGTLDVADESGVVACTFQASCDAGSNTVSADRFIVWFT